jgi:uncharacterized caspase-like protein
MQTKSGVPFLWLSHRLKSIYVSAEDFLRIAAVLLGVALLSGCASMSSSLSKPYIAPEVASRDPGKVDVRVSVANAVMGPEERGKIDLSRVTQTVYEVIRKSGSFREVTMGTALSDYEFVPSVIALEDVFDNVVHLRLQGRNRATSKVIYDHKFVGWNFTQGASLRNISAVLADQMPTIRSAIYADLRRSPPLSQSSTQIGTHRPSHPQLVAPKHPKSVADDLPQVVQPAKPEDAYKLPGARWAVVIGISTYQDSRVPTLRYAIRDAQAFYAWLVSANGGRYAPSRVRLLLDREATGKALKDALFGWLKQVLEEDTVIIYFAGHGSPESPDSPENLFLLPFDTQYDNIPSTGFPMWDIETALKRYIKAKKVVVLADACHSGGVGQSFDIARRANRSLKINPISTGIHGLSKVGDGICVISASDEHQYSQESKDWGGGHGVFTYFLLKGLKGDADFNKDRSVTLGELTSYLSQEVRRATKNAQSPTVAGRYDPALTIGE